MADQNKGRRKSSRSKANNLRDRIKKASESHRPSHRPKISVRTIISKAINDALSIVPGESRNEVRQKIFSQTYRHIATIVRVGIRSKTITSIKAVYSVANHIAHIRIEEYLKSIGRESYIPKPPINPPKV